MSVRAAVGGCAAAFLLVAWPVALWAQTTTSEPPAAGSDTQAQASAHFDRGLRLVEQRLYAQALAEFERAYALSHDDAVLYNLGMASVMVNKPVEAIDALERYLASARVHPDAAERARVEETIGRQRLRTGSLDLTVTPRSAALYIDGRALEAKSSGPIVLAAGEHRVVGMLSGYEVADEVTTVRAQESTSLTLELKPLARALPMSYLPVRCAVPDVTLWIDGDVTSLRSSSVLLHVRAGAHLLTFRRTGYADSVMPVHIAPGNAAAVDCSLRALAPLPGDLAGSLRVRGLSPEAEVRVDEQPLPVDGRIPLGRHHVTVERPGFAAWGRDVEIRVGQTQQLEVGEPLVAPADIAQGGPHTQRTLGYVVGATGLAVGAAAVVVYLVADSQYDTWQDAQQDLDAVTAKALQQPDDTAKHSTAEREIEASNERLRSVWTLDDWALGLGVAAGVLLIGAGVLYWTAPSSDAGEPARRDLSLSLHGTGLDFRARF